MEGNMIEFIFNFAVEIKNTVNYHNFIKVKLCNFCKIIVYFYQSHCEIKYVMKKYIEIQTVEIKLVRF